MPASLEEVTNPCNEESQLLGDPVEINLIHTPGFKSSLSFNKEFIQS